MKDSYVLDENVAVCAATGRNERNQEDPSSLKLLRVLYDQCHALSFSNELWNKWQQKLSSLHELGAHFSAAVFRYLRLFQLNPEKFSFVPEPEMLQSEDLIPEDDVYIVRLAVESNSTAIATTDNRLIRRLRGASVTERLPLLVLRPEGALARLVPPR